MWWTVGLQLWSRIDHDCRPTAVVARGPAGRCRRPAGRSWRAGSDVGLDPNRTLKFISAATDPWRVAQDRTPQDDLDRRLDELRRAMLRRSAASGRVPAATLARLTAVLPAAPATAR